MSNHPLDDWIREKNVFCPLIRARGGRMFQNWFPPPLTPEFLEKMNNHVAAKLRLLGISESQIKELLES